MEVEPTVFTAAEPDTNGELPKDEGVDMGLLPQGDAARGQVNYELGNIMNSGTITTLDGEMAGDELEGDAINYQILLGKIDCLLERLKLDA